MAIFKTIYSLMFSKKNVKIKEDKCFRFLFPLLFMLPCAVMAQQMSRYQLKQQSFSSSKPFQTIASGQTPEGVDAGSWQSILRQMRMSKYKAYPDGKGGYTTANLRHGFQIVYNAGGSTILTPRNRDEADYYISIKVTGVGYAELHTIGTPNHLQNTDLGKESGSKLSYIWNENLTEWWVNDNEKLEQWFSLKQAPGKRMGQEPLRLRLELQTNMAVQQRGNQLIFNKGNSTLTYDKLKVWDANGNELNARVELKSGHQMELHIEDAGAAYPLLIDPAFSQQAYLKASNTEVLDQFGHSVAISGETIVIGAIGENSNATGVNGNQSDNSSFGSGAAYVFIRTGNTWSQQAYLKASNTGSSDQFGHSVAISGETIVVGAIGEDGSGTGINPADNNSAASAGAAYVFVRSGSSWSQQAYLKASNTGATDNFGYSVAISGETVVVGAHLEDGSGTGVNPASNNSATDAGAAFVYIRSGSSWSQQAYLKASNTGAGDQFGKTVSISGETVVIGAFFEDGSGTGVNPASNNSASNSGAAYVFLRSGSSWAQQAYLKASNTEANDYFGHSVAISGETIVVGAYLEYSSATGVNGNQADNSTIEAGAAYVFVRNGSSWSQQAYLKASNTGLRDQFGWSVAISGETIVVGAHLEDGSGTGVNPPDNDGATNPGAAYVFVRSGSNWSQRAYLKASNTEGGDFFGWSVAVSSETIVVGALFESSNATGINGNQTNNDAGASGAAYIFVTCSTSSSLATNSNTSETSLITGSTTFNGSDCGLIATITPNGASPISGIATSTVWIESSVPNVAGQPFVARHYEITPATNPTTATGRVTLYFTQQEFTDFNNDPGSILDLPTGPADAVGKANLRIEKRNGTSSNGTGLPTTYSGSITTIDPADADIVWNATLSRWEVSFDVTGFSGFFVKTTPSVLPLTLLEFNGRLQNGDALLNWKTENEVNTDQFLVERSTDGRNFTTVGTVDARNQPGANLYNYTDAGVNILAASMVYYRLKQTDVDSRFTYSRIIALPLSKQNSLMLYPNPASDVLMVTLSAERAEKVQVRIMDNAGRILRQQQWNIATGSATIQLEVSSLAKGMYYLEVKGETTDQRKTFIRQ